MTGLTTQPVFLMSLPRSGSTMIQRRLGKHAQIATVSEPWFMLGLVDPAAHHDAAATYGFATYRVAIEDLFAALPMGRSDWDDAVRGAAETLYGRLAQAQADTEAPARYFLDKTPRYALIPDEIARIFPDAPIIVLWRNPLAIAASMLSTWGDGRWNLYRFTQDFHFAFPRLAEFVRSHPNRVLCLDYDMAVSDPEGTELRIMAYIGLEPDSGPNSDHPPLSGRLGDPTGGMNRTAQTSGPKRWTQQFCNPLRRAWGRRLLRRLGDDVLETAGFERAALEADLASCSRMTRFLLGDLVRMPVGLLCNLLALRIVRRQFARLARGLPISEMD